MNPLPSIKTKIVATIGPASESPPVLEAMLRAGMNVARLNFSHGDFDSHERVIANLRDASKVTGLRVAIMADLSGPKMRIGNLGSEPIQLEVGQLFTLTVEEVEGDCHRVSVSFEKLPQVVKPGDMLFLNDGLIQLEVARVCGRDVECVVAVGGELRSRKGLNFRGIDLGISAFTAQDRECLAFALKSGVDAVSQSFVESAADIVTVRQAASDLGYSPFIVAKIERSRALDHLDEILDAADAVMIARGDLGVEVPIERIAVVQKDITRRANQRAKPVITATQMLESMTSYRLPTRAEATDVANAILDGTDCVMLSAESATGSYPVEAVAMLAKIAASVEPIRRPVSVADLYRGTDFADSRRPQQMVALGIEACFQSASPVVVVAPTRSGTSARRMALLRLPVWTLALSASEQVCRNLQFSAGVFPLYETSDPETWTRYVQDWVRQQGLQGQFALLTTGASSLHPDQNLGIEVIEL